MLMNEENPVPELVGMFDDGSPCMKRAVFLGFLDVELERARRYGSYVSLLTLRVKGPSRLQELARFLQSKLRQSDYLARLEDRTLAVVLLNSKPDNTAFVLRRLAEATLEYLGGEIAGEQVLSASSVFPTDANSLDDLRDSALGRLQPVVVG